MFCLTSFSGEKVLSSSRQ
uniref:Uncharacterized protein n=1 Tax=Anguilla anguilla TaxID=7936 RepID=A0A0E9RXK5_ANGAN